MRAYIAGPMSGLPDLNFPAFHEAAARLRAFGWDVVNPAEINPDHGMPWAECMRRDIAQLVTCQGIVLLSGWENSRRWSRYYEILAANFTASLGELKTYLESRA